MVHPAVLHVRSMGREHATVDVDHQLVGASYDLHCGLHAQHNMLQLVRSIKTSAMQSALAAAATEMITHICESM